MFDKFDEELDIISELPDRPLEGVDRITTEQLKAKFDTAGKMLKVFLNNWIEAIAAGTAAANIGAKITVDGQQTSVTLQEAIDAAMESGGGGGGGDIPDGAVTAAKLASNAVVSSKIKNGAVTAGKIGANAVSTILKGTLATSGWSGSSAPYTKSVSVGGLLSTDSPIVDLEFTGTASTDLNRVGDFAHIYRIVTYDGGFTAYADQKPAVTLPLRLLCIRK